MRLKKSILRPGGLDFWHIVTITVLALAGFFLIYPFTGLVIRSFVSERTGEPTLMNYHRFATFAYYYRTLFNSLSVSFSTTFLAVLLGVPMAYIYSRYNIWGKKLLKILVIVSLLSPPFIGAYAWIMLLGRAGFITRFLAGYDIIVPNIYGFPGLLLVFTLKLFPFVFLYVSGALGSMDASLEEAAENLGSKRLAKVFTITFPLVLPTISAGAVAYAGTMPKRDTMGRQSKKRTATTTDVNPVRPPSPIPEALSI